MEPLPVGVSLEATITRTQFETEIILKPVWASYLYSIFRRKKANCVNSNQLKALGNNEIDG